MIGRKLTGLDLDEVVELERIAGHGIFAIVIDVLVDETLLVDEATLFGYDGNLWRLSGDCVKDGRQDDQRGLVSRCARMWISAALGSHVGDRLTGAKHLGGSLSMR